ncbi:MAG: ribosome maturation factor RimM [Negativicoccus succinicivorans]|nr:ribosome maturation factor RimM [Negativicoccus succinicivorans]
MSTDMLVVGRIVAAHGVRGEVRLKPDTDRPEMLTALPHLYLGGNRYQIQSARFHKQMLIVQFKGIADRNAADALIGLWAELPREELPPRAQGQFYIVDLVGMEVVTENGTVLGTLQEVLQPGANDVFVVRGEREEILVPALKRVVSDIDLDAKRLTVTDEFWANYHEN